MSVSKFKLWFNTNVSHRLTSNKLPFCIQDVISSHPMNNNPYRKPRNPLSYMIFFGLHGIDQALLASSERISAVVLEAFTVGPSRKKIAILKISVSAWCDIVHNSFWTKFKYLYSDP